MLKHASPLRSSPGQSQSQTQPPTSPEEDSPAAAHLRDSYSERGVDCDSLIVPASFAQAERAAGYQVGTWSGVSQASVRRGLSFSARRAPDAVSFRSVRSEGQATLPPASGPSSSTSMTDMTTLKRQEEAGRGNERGVHCLKGDMASLKSLLRLPGVRGHARIIEVTKDGVLLSPETLSLNSADSFFSANSGRTSSRSWSSNASSNSSGTNASSGSNSSTSEPASTTIRVFAKCLRSDIEYKTISVNTRASCREVVALLLSKYRMRHRDPNLFYLTMEVTVRRCSGAPVRSLLVLEEGARPAQLALCRPPGDSRFALQMRRGGVVKIHDTVLMPGSQYKSLLVSDRTTAEEVVQLLLNCYNRRDNKCYYAIHEVRRSPEFSDRMIQTEERLLEVKARWPRDRQAEFVFVLRRNMAQALSLRKLSLRTAEVKWAADCVGEAVGGSVNSAPPPRPAPPLQTAPHPQPAPSTELIPYTPPAPHHQVPPHPQPATHPQPTPYPQPAHNLHPAPYTQPPPPLHPTPYPHPHPQPTQHTQIPSHPQPIHKPHPRPAHKLHPQPAPPRHTLLEGAVIDCTDVTPRMTTINRTPPSTSTCLPAPTPVCPSVNPAALPCLPTTSSVLPTTLNTTPEVFSAKTLASGVPARPPPPEIATTHGPPTGTTHPYPPTTSHVLPPPTTRATSSVTHGPPPPTTHSMPNSHVSPPTTNASPPTTTHAPDTRDSATNTEVKEVSNNSTQTVVSKRVIVPPYPVPHHLLSNPPHPSTDPQPPSKSHPLSSTLYSPPSAPPPSSTQPSNDQQLHSKSHPLSSTLFNTTSNTPSLTSSSSSFSSTQHLLPPDYPPPPPPPPPPTEEVARLPPPSREPLPWQHKAGSDTPSTSKREEADGVKDVTSCEEWHSTTNSTSSSSLPPTTSSPSSTSSTPSSLSLATSSPSTTSSTTSSLPATTVTSSSTSSVSFSSVTSTTTSTTSTTTTTTMKTDTCKHNCQHCFYI